MIVASGIRHLQIDHGKRKPEVKGGLVPKVVRGQSKLYKNADEAVADLKSGSTILSAGFGLCGTAGMADYSITPVSLTHV